ncbi:isochorismatase family protein (plasmid) [Bacillus mycoides]|nr:isochorismatase family protein [Bacillus mycoides]
MNALQLDFQKTALVLIYLQKGIDPIPGSKKVVENIKKLIQHFRENNGFISFVCVDLQNVKYKHLKDWAEFTPELITLKGGETVTKRQWGAFFSSDLDLQLRRRGIDTIVLCGIATDIGVESTAREAFQLGYQQIFITDAMINFSREEYKASCSYVFPKIGRFISVQDFFQSVKEVYENESE